MRVIRIPCWVDPTGDGLLRRKAKLKLPSATECHGSSMISWAEVRKISARI